jgi:hypothetical protein
MGTILMTTKVFVLAKNPFKQFMEITEDFTSFEFEGEVHCGDQYHKLEDLYEHRHALFYALTKIYDNYITPFNTKVSCWKSKLHDDGTMFEDSFIVGMTIRTFDGTVEYITYHIPLSWWDKFKLIELKNAPVYDGHTSDDVLERLMRL